MSNTNPPAAARARQVWLWIGCMLLAGYAVFLGLNYSSVAGGADSSGYMNSARLLASGRLAADLRTPVEFGPQDLLRRQQFQPHGFVPFDGTPGLSPTYAVGLPIHLAVAGTIFGWNAAPIIVGVGGALAALLLCYAVGRQVGLGAPLAAAAAVLLGCFPVFVFMSLQPLSDTLATTWCLAAMASAFRSRWKPSWAIACGFAVALAVLVRATNILVVPAVLLVIGLRIRALLLFILGGIPGAIWLGYYNHTLYGSPFQSGYIDISQAFALSHGLPTLLHFGQWLALLLPSVVLLLPFAAFRGNHELRIVVALLLWFAAFVGLYAFYEISREVWWDLRFIMPGIPGLILVAMLGVESLLNRYSPVVIARARALCAGVLALWAVGLGWFWTNRFHLLLTKRYEQAYLDASAAARQHFAPNALIVAGQHSGALYYYTTFSVLRYEFVSPEEFARFRTLAAKAGRQIAAVVYQTEEQEALQQKCPGNWEKVATLNNITLWRLAP
jgi:hypothetical protein